MTRKPSPFSTFDNRLSPTGRLMTSKPQEQRLPSSSVTGRMVAPLRMTPVQQELWDKAATAPVDVGGQLFSRLELSWAFQGVQIPKDPVICGLLDLKAFDGKELEFRTIERFIQQST